ALSPALKGGACGGRFLVRNRFLNAQFRDFHYRVTIAPEKGYIASIVVNAQNKNAPTRLAVNLDLGDFNKPFRIEPPVHSNR
ncbi:hypothetical protein, partial [Thermodesulfitimonas sp.]